MSKDYKEDFCVNSKEAFEKVKQKRYAAFGGKENWEKAMENFSMEKMLIQVGIRVYPKLKEHDRYRARCLSQAHTRYVI